MTLVQGIITAQVRLLTVNCASEQCGAGKPGLVCDVTEATRKGCHVIQLFPYTFVHHEVAYTTTQLCYIAKYACGLYKAEAYYLVESLPRLSPIGHIASRS